MKFSLRLYKPLEFKEIKKIKEFTFGVNRRWKLLDKYPELEKDIVYIDTPLEFKDYPTIEGLYLLKDLAKDKIYLDEQGTIDFIYGKNVHRKYVIKVEGYKYAKNMLVLSSKGDPLGIGRFERRWVINLFNISFYRKY